MLIERWLFCFCQFEEFLHAIRESYFGPANVDGSIHSVLLFGWFKPILENFIFIYFFCFFEDVLEGGGVIIIPSDDSG